MTFPEIFKAGCCHPFSKSEQFIFGRNLYKYIKYINIQSGSASQTSGLPSEYWLPIPIAPNLKRVLDSDLTSSNHLNENTSQQVALQQRFSNQVFNCTVKLILRVKWILRVKQIPVHPVMTRLLLIDTSKSWTVFTNFVLLIDLLKEKKQTVVKLEMIYWWG